MPAAQAAAAQIDAQEGLRRLDRVPPSPPPQPRRRFGCDVLATRGTQRDAILASSIIETAPQPPTAKRVAPTLLPSSRSTRTNWPPWPAGCCCAAGSAGRPAAHRTRRLAAARRRAPPPCCAASRNSTSRCPSARDTPAPSPTTERRRRRRRCPCALPTGRRRFRLAPRRKMKLPAGIVDPRLAIDRHRARLRRVVGSKRDVLLRKARSVGIGH